MKLVIEINEETYKYWKKHKCEMVIKAMSPYINISKAIANGTPLTDCADAISRSAVIDIFYNTDGLEYFENSNIFAKAYADKIKSLPSVNPTSEPFINKPCCISEKVCHEDKTETLDKIRAEIIDKYMTADGRMGSVSADILKIIDKYSKGGDSNA